MKAPWFTIGLATGAMANQKPDPREPKKSVAQKVGGFFMGLFWLAIGLALTIGVLWLGSVTFQAAREDQSTPMATK